MKRMLFGEEKPDLSELEAGSTTILDILSPTTVDTKSRDYTMAVLFNCIAESESDLMIDPYLNAICAAV